jgi:hypothetical protein
MKKLVIGLLALCCSVSARGSEYLAIFDGHVTYVDDSVPGAGIALNDRIVGSVRYDADAPANPATLSPTMAEYPGNVRELTLEYLRSNGPVLTFTSTGGSSVVYNSSGLYAFDVSATEGLEEDDIDGHPVVDISLYLQNVDGLPGQTVAIPTELSLDLFTPSFSFIDLNINEDRNSVIEAHIDSIRVIPVSEPSSAALAGICSALVWARTRSKRVVKRII